MAKKKTNGLSVAIVALNIVIVGLIILLVVLVYLHMKEDTDNGRTEGTTTTHALSGSESATESEEPAVSLSNASDVIYTSGSEEVPADESEWTVIAPIMSYDRSFFANDLFIGDSIFTGLYIYDFLDKFNVFAEVGMDPGTALTHQIDGVTCIEKTASMQPRNIYIMLGTNGLADFDLSYMANQTVQLIARLETACPTAGIYIMTIPPVTAAHEAEGRETMELVNRYNSLLKDICIQGGYGCIDLCSVLRDETGYLSARYAEADGMHFLGDAYITMLGYIQQTA